MLFFPPGVFSVNSLTFQFSVPESISISLFYETVFIYDLKWRFKIILLHVTIQWF